MDSIFKLLVNTTLLKIIYPVLIAALVYGGISYLRIGRLESTIEGLHKEKYKLEAQVQIYDKMVEGATDQIRLAEEQCRRLLEYEQNKPKPLPSADDDSDVDSLVNRLLSHITGSPTNASGKGKRAPCP